jgi:hypothetical protein
MLTSVFSPRGSFAFADVPVTLVIMAGYRGVVEGAFPVFQLGLLGLLLWGLFAKKSLAWQYLRVIGVLAFTD